MIHNSSVIDKKAKISNSVKIGPFCNIGPNVELSDGVELISKRFPKTSIMIEHNSFHPIFGIKHFFYNRVQLMVGAWNLKKLTANLSYRYTL